MRKLELLLLVGTAFMALTHFASAQDSGLPDTLYLEVYPPDTVAAAFLTSAPTWMGPASISFFQLHLRDPDTPQSVR